MARLLRRALLGLVACVTLAACGAVRQAGEPSGGVAAGRGPFPLRVEHAMGTTRIPAPPERVVVLDTGELDSVTALGIEPVGAVRAPVADGFLDYLEDYTQETQLVGTITEPNLEKIAALRPDLILSSVIRHEKIYDRLADIAPTVFTETVGVVWKENFLKHAEALGRLQRARSMLEDYEERARRLGERIEAETGGLPEVSVVRFLPGEIRLYQKASFIGTVLEDVGLPRPPSQDAEEFARIIGPEQVRLMDGDVVFITSYGPEDDTPKPSVVNSALWNRLDAVRQGDVYEMPDDVWMLGIGIQAANLVLDDFEEVLLNG